MHQASRVILPRPLDSSSDGREPPRGGGNFDPSAIRKRSSVKAACLACQTRHSKCSGERPSCVACVDKGTVCQYEVSPGKTRAETRKEQLGRAQADNSSFFEILRYLRYTSADRAHEFLEFIRADDSASIASMRQWLRENHPEDLQALSSPLDYTASSSSAIVSDFSYAQASSTESSRAFEDTTEQTASTSSPFGVDMTPIGLSGNNVTVTTIKAAVNMFIQCTGSLFYVFSRAQVDAITREVLKEFKMTDDMLFVDVMKVNSRLNNKSKLAELCGMAAVGVHYLNTPEPQNSTAGLADYFYSITKLLLDNVIDIDPLRAMKVCALLAMHNIPSRSNVALAHVEMALGLGRSRGLSSKQCPQGMEEGTFVEYRKVWRSLVLFSGWLHGSLGYIPIESDYFLLQNSEDSATDEDAIQREIVKVTIMKSRIIREIHIDGPADDMVVGNIQKDLRAIHDQLPSWMSIASLLNPLQTSPTRQIVSYFHLFFLSAMQLLHRRLMIRQEHLASTSSHQNAKAAVREGLMAAKMASRVLGLMKTDDSIVRNCWLCIFSSYTTSLIILQAAIQKLMHGFPMTVCAADLSLVSSSLEDLVYCAEVDKLAGRFRDTVKRYLDLIYEIVDGDLEQDPSMIGEEGNSVDYLFTIPSGDMPIHKAARDLLSLIQRPFVIPFELNVENELTMHQRRTTVFTFMEEVLGTLQEWHWESQS